MKLRLGDHQIETQIGADLAALQSAVALLRTVFEDHYVDPDHQSCLFFHGRTIAGAQNQHYDFTLVHREDRVMLSDFTFPWKGPAYISLPLHTYAREVIRFAENVAATEVRLEGMPAWQRSAAELQSTYLADLLALTRRYIDGEAGYDACCAVFQDVHGRLKRPLELEVLAVLEAAEPFEPCQVEARITFGPVRLGEILPVRIHRGDMLRGVAEEFSHQGVRLRLEGVGSGGIRPGDRLYGMQLFYA
ncbi:MAG TPA: hypothetical protein VGK74_29020 [Symbiobacteriaceae bacterium]|jgi:hypothetical protein